MFAKATNSLLNFQISEGTDWLFWKRLSTITAFTKELLVHVQNALEIIQAQFERAAIHQVRAEITF